MPVQQEDRKKLELEYNFNNKLNPTLVVIENGLIVDTVYPKSSVDSINNSLYYTYNNHLNKQKFKNPIKHALNYYQFINVLEQFVQC